MAGWLAMALALVRMLSRVGFGLRPDQKKAKAKTKAKRKKTQIAG
jgi:hypothetical protein